MKSMTWKQLVVGTLLAIGVWTAIGASGSATSSATGTLQLTDGRKVVAAAGTPEALGTFTGAYAVSITALDTNTGTIVVGGSTVIAAAGTRTGRPLTAGETMTIGGTPTVAGFHIDGADIYLDATVTGEGVSWVALHR